MMIKPVYSMSELSYVSSGTQFYPCAYVLREPGKKPRFLVWNESGIICDRDSKRMHYRRKKNSLGSKIQEVVGLNSAN